MALQVGRPGTRVCQGEPPSPPSPSARFLRVSRGPVQLQVRGPDAGSGCGPRWEEGPRAGPGLGLGPHLLLLAAPGGGWISVCISQAGLFVF